MRHELIPFLQTPPTFAEKVQEQDILQRLDSARSQFDSRKYEIPFESLQKLQVARCLASGTLKSRNGLEGWDKAHQVVHTWIVEEKTLSRHSDLFYLYTIMTGCYTASYRTVSVYTSNNKHPEPEHLFSLMDAFFKMINSPLKEHPIQRAARARQWIASIHPFEDGNGRVSQILADYFLIKEGYLPQSYDHPRTAMVVGLPNKIDYVTPHFAFVNVAESVLHSYRLMGVV